MFELSQDARGGNLTVRIREQGLRVLETGNRATMASDQLLEIDEGPVGQVRVHQLDESVPIVPSRVDVSESWVAQHIIRANSFAQCSPPLLSREKKVEQEVGVLAAVAVLWRPQIPGQGVLL